MDLLVKWSCHEELKCHHFLSLQSVIYHVTKWAPCPPWAGRPLAPRGVGQPAYLVGGLQGFPRQRLVDSFLNLKYWHLCKNMGVCRAGSSEQSAFLGKYFSFSVSRLFLKRHVRNFSQFKDEYVFSFHDATQSFSAKTQRNHPFCCLANNLLKWAVLIYRSGMRWRKAELWEVSFFFFLGENDRSLGWARRSSPKSQVHTAGGGDGLTACSVNPSSYVCSHTFSPKANANLVCMEMIYSESWVTFLVTGTVMAWQHFPVFFLCLAHVNVCSFPLTKTQTNINFIGPTWHPSVSHTTTWFIYWNS